MPIQRIFMFVFCLLAVIPACVSADTDTPRELLAKVIQQLDSQPYKASAVYVRPSGMVSVDIERAKNVERLTYNADPEYQNIQTSSKEIRIYPATKNKIEHVGKYHFNGLRALHQNPIETTKFYNLFISDQLDYVAGQNATRLSIISITKDRYSYIHWVDSSSSVILRTDVLDEKGELIERMVFTAFSLKNEHDWVTVSSVDEVSEKTKLLTYTQEVDSKALRFTWLPEGFHIHSIESVRDDECTLGYERIVLTDGFASIEVYTYKNDHQAKLTRGQQLDTFHVYKEVLSGLDVSIEGQVPYAVLEKIALGLKVKGAIDENQVTAR